MAAVVLLVAVTVYRGFDSRADRKNFDYASETDPVGLQAVDCWFEADDDWPQSECYFMQLPENHADPQSRLVSFPLLVFRSQNLFKSANPVLHLGSGGPGAANQLDSKLSVESILQAYDELSLDIGRDLFIIDPRGTGLSTPLLTCQLYVDHELERLNQNLSLIEVWTSSDQDYIQCIEQFKQLGIDFNYYNSLSISRDIEALRKATAVKQWTLIGVSYAAVYAQFIARFFPDSVEAMILDSPAFPSLKKHHNYLQRVMAPYEMLFSQCGDEDGCADEKESESLQARFWEMHAHLNQNPLKLRVVNPFTRNRIPVILNGERFLSAVAEGVYGTDIFRELKQIMRDLAAGDTRSIYPYLKSHLAYLLDRRYGDVSADAHYCYEDKPFIDFDLIRKLSDELPAGYIRDTNKLWLDWPDQCERMEVRPGSPELARAVAIDTPTLFLQGTLDAITPLSDVESQRTYFPDSELLTFELSHDILGSSGCAEIMAGYFIQHKTLGKLGNVCE